jgi:hypothetical protein
LAEYSNEDDIDPVKLTFANTCHAEFLQIEARQASKPPTARKRPLPPTANVNQPPAPRITRLRRTAMETKNQSTGKDVSTES